MSDTLQSHFAALENTLNEELVERHQEIYGAMVALVAGSTYFQLGVPGTAKSLLSDRMVRYISDVEYFKILMSKFTQPEELFGPVSLTALEDDRFVHMIDQYLPTANVVFLDEVWKSSSACINSLLMALNERRYKHGTDLIKIPLGLGLFASNELPDGSELEAIYDRLVLRFKVEPIADADSFRKMLTTVRPENPEPIMSWSDIERAQKEAAEIIVPDRVLDAFVNMREELREVGIEASERRYVEAMKLVRAAAWLEECDVADTDHMLILEHVFWRDPEERPTVSRVVTQHANPLEQEVIKLLANIKTLDVEISGAETDDEKMKVGNEVHPKLKNAHTEFRDLAARANSNSRSRRLDQAKEALRSTTYRALVDIFKFDPTEAKARLQNFETD